MEEWKILSFSTVLVYIYFNYLKNDAGCVTTFSADPLRKEHWSWTIFILNRFRWNSSIKYKTTFIHAQNVSHAHKEQFNFTLN